MVDCQSPDLDGGGLWGGWGWVPASARTTGGGAGGSEGSWDERWIVVPVFTGVGSVRGMGMGPRIREDNGRGRGGCQWQVILWGMGWGDGCCEGLFVLA